MDSEDSSEQVINQVDPKRKQYLSEVFELKKQLPKTLPKLIQQRLSRKDELDIDYLNQLVNQVKVPPPRTVKKQVCAKVINKKQLLVECYDCRFDSSCVICMDCYKNSNHAGHKIVIRESSGGCCDCGDKEAWKETGFCNKHSGNFLDFQVNHDHLEITKQQFHLLFYIYFYLHLNNHKHKIPFSENLISKLQKINHNNPYYNKITALCLNCPLAHQLNSALDKCTVLQNLHKFAISGMFIRKWFNLFMAMFGYYPFKLQLLKTYIQMYPEIVDGSSESFNAAGSISCQLLTSHQLISKYASQCKIGLGQGSLGPPSLKLVDTKIVKTYYLRMLFDINYILKLKGTAPQQYLEMHLSNEEGLSNFFNYYDQMSVLCKKLTEDGLNTATIMINLVEFFYVQNYIIQVFALMLTGVQDRKILFNKVMQFLWRKCLEYVDDKEDPVFIFRPYQRCFGMALFSYFQFSYTSVNQKCQKLCKQVLRIPPQLFKTKCLRILQRQMKSFLVYPRFIIEPGLSQSLYVYLYFYKLKYHLISCVDIITIKTLLLVCNDKLIINLGNLGNENQTEAEISKSKLLLNNTLAFIKYLYTFYVSESNLACQIHSNEGFYRQQTIYLLKNMYREQKGLISIQKMNIIAEKLFSKNVKYINDWVKENTTINKEKKVFSINTQNIQLPGLNYGDLWENSLKEDSQFCDPYKTKQAVYGANIQVFSKIWHSLAITQLVQQIKKLYTANNSGIQTVLSNVLHIYLIKQSFKLSEEVKFLQQEILAPNIQKIPSEIYSKLEQKNLLKRSNVNKESQEEKNKEKERKKKLMQMKKQKMNQKFKVTQQKMLNQMQQEDLVLKKYSSVSSEKMIEENQHEFCCICRNENQEDFVYLLKMEMRNHEQYLSLGKGLSCLSFYSCYHAFDQKCLHKQLSKIQTGLIRCPLCRSNAQTVIPLRKVQKTQKSSHDVMERIFQVLLNSLNRDNLESVHQQIIKSFYGFILICVTNPKNLYSKRFILYKIILENLARSLNVKQLDQLQDSLVNGYIQSKMIKMEKERKSKERKSQRDQNREFASSQSQRKSKRKKKGRRKKMELQPIIQESRQYQLSNFTVLIQQDASRYSLFESIIRLFTLFLKAKIKDQKIQELNLQNWKYRMQSSTDIGMYTNIVAIFIKIIFEQQLTAKQKQQLDNFNGLPLNNTSILKRLPNRYIDIETSKQCSECGQLNSQILLCLFCFWRGCQKCPQGASLSHVLRQHEGGVGVFMDLQTSDAYYISEIGVQHIGQLYQNDWGHSLKRNDNWDEFKLNQSKIKQIESILYYDKPLSI